MNKFEGFSAVQLLQLLETKEVSSKEVMQYFIDRIEAVNPSLNAVVIKLYDAALKKAEEADNMLLQGKRMGKLHGLPFTIKECLDLPCTPSTLGLMRRMNDFPEKTDAYVDALQQEGGIILGKTNVAQLLMYFESCNPVYGVTNNPHSAAHTCGGSSGGEGAIIAAGGSPVGIGTDIGGSLRIPAAFCGICSIKPTMSRTIDLTRFIENQVNPSINSVTGVLGNYAEDLQLFLEIMNNVAGKQRLVDPLQDFRNIDLSKLKIGYFLSDGIFEPMPAIKRAVLEAVGKLRAMGMEVIEFEPPALSEAEELFFRILSADNGPLFTDNLQKEKAMPQVKGLIMLSKCSPLIRSILFRLTGLLGQQSVKRIIPYFGGHGETNQKEMTAWQHAYIERYLSAMNNTGIGNLDAIISPVCALPAFLHNTADKVGLGGTYTLQHNVTGFPSGVATISKVKPEEAVGRKTTSDGLVKTASRIEASSAGLPLSVQIAARPWNEHIVLAIINQLHERG